MRRSQLCSSCQISLVGWLHCISIQVSRFHHPLCMPEMYRVWTCSNGLYARVPEDTEDPTWTVCYVAVRFEELAIFVLTLSVSWVSACGLVGGYRSHATRGESPRTPQRVAYPIVLPLCCRLPVLCAANQRLALCPAQSARPFTGMLAACRPSYSTDAGQCCMADSYACRRMQPDIGDSSRGWCICGRGRVWKSAALGCSRVGPWNATSRPDDLI